MLNRQDKFTSKQIGSKIKERRKELNMTMSELGQCIGVNKSTIQRYESGNIDPDRTMIITSLAAALKTSPEWLTGLADDREYKSYTVCQQNIENHINEFLKKIAEMVDREEYQQFLTAFLGQFVDMYTITCEHFERAVNEAATISEDEDLRASLNRYSLETSAVTDQTYRREMESPVEDMKRMIDCLLNLYDSDYKNSFNQIVSIKAAAQERLIRAKEINNSGNTRNK